MKTVLVIGDAVEIGMLCVAARGDLPGRWHGDQELQKGSRALGQHDRDAISAKAYQQALLACDELFVANSSASIVPEWAKVVVHFMASGRPVTWLDKKLAYDPDIIGAMLKCKQS